MNQNRQIFNEIAELVKQLEHNFNEADLSYKERARFNKLPIPYSVYKGIAGKNGALRFVLKNAYQDEKDEGCVFLEMAPTVGKNEYDWQNQKISIALNLTDISQIIMFFSSPHLDKYRYGKNKQEKNIPSLDIYHDNTIDQKTLKFEKDPLRENFTLQAAKRKDNKELAKVFIPLSPEEVLIIGSLLRTAIPKILSWD